MDSLLLQKQVRENAQSLQDFCKELKDWGAEMKKKEDSLKSRTNDTNENKQQEPCNSKTESNNKEPQQLIAKKSKRIKGNDYAAWEKFNADAYCAKMDGDKSSDESELSDEIDETMIDLANSEKEKGNNFVKKQRWDDAIKCYNKSIEYYAYDPIYYANRALCHLKKLNYRNAESDCTTALQLDKTYVKAYQRRAVARENLNQLKEAHDDLLKVLELEPKNKESAMLLAKIEKKIENIKKPSPEICEAQRPVSKFTLSRQKQNKPSSESDKKHLTTTAMQEHVIEKIRPIDHEPNIQSDFVKTSIDLHNNLNKLSPHWPSANKTELFQSIKKPPNSRSKKPLKRIEIVEIDSSLERSVKKDTDAIIEHERIGSSQIIHMKNIEVTETKELKPNSTIIENKQEPGQLPTPKNSIQFYNAWRTMKNNRNKYLYLKQINPENLPVIFKESLESKVFSDILKILSVDFIENIPDCGCLIYMYLKNLSKVKRFSTLTMFMSSEDKQSLLKLFDFLKENCSNTDNVNDLMKRYNI